MPTSRFSRSAFACVFVGLASLSISACSGGGATTGAGGASPLGSGPGSGSGGSGGGASAGPSTAPTGSSTNGPVSGGGSSAAPTSAPTSSASASPTPSFTATPSSLNSLNVVPAILDGDLGGVAQIGIIDPNYTGAYTVSVAGGGLLGNLLNTVANTTQGTLQGKPNGTTTLTLNLANAVQLGLLGPNGSLVTICEQQNPATCKQVDIANNGVVPVVGSTLNSIVLGPSSFQTFGLIAPALSFTNFNVVSTPNGISVTNLGNGQFMVSAAANASPVSGNIVISDGMGHTVTIPIAVP